MEQKCKYNKVQKREKKTKTGFRVNRKKKRRKIYKLEYKITIQTVYTKNKGIILLFYPVHLDNSFR